MNNNVLNTRKIFENWETSILQFLPKLLLAAFVLVVFGFLASLARQICRRSFARMADNKVNRALIKTITGTAYLFFLLSGLFISLQIVGLEALLTKILAGAGVVGIVAGFAFKDIASNAFAGLLLDFQRPFTIGDWVELGGSYGTVAEIGWLTTAVDTVPGQRVFVPNQTIYSNSFTNYSTFQRRRVVLESGVSYGDDLELVRSEALEAVKSSEGVLTDQTIDFYFTAIGNSTYNFQLRFWIDFHKNDDYQKAKSDIIVHIKRQFEKADISIAYPVTTLDFGVKGGVNLFDRALTFQQEAGGDSTKN